MEREGIIERDGLGTKREGSEREDGGRVGRKREERDRRGEGGRNGKRRGSNEEKKQNDCTTVKAGKLEAGVFRYGLATQDTLLLEP